MAPRIFQGSRVFIGLRPNIFERVENQHITLDYIGSYPEWNTLLHQCALWHQRFGNGPVTVEVNGYANWFSSNNEKDRYFDVALIGFRDYPELTYLKNWHITLGKSDTPVKPRQFDKERDAFRYDHCDDIWIGYRDPNGEAKWLRYMGSVGTLTPEELEPSSWQM